MTTVQDYKAKFDQIKQEFDAENTAVSKALGEVKVILNEVQDSIDKLDLEEQQLAEDLITELLQYLHDTQDEE